MNKLFIILLLLLCSFIVYADEEVDYELHVNITTTKVWVYDDYGNKFGWDNEPRNVSFNMSIPKNLTYYSNYTGNDYYNNVQFDCGDSSITLPQEAADTCQCAPSVSCPNVSIPPQDNSVQLELVKTIDKRLNPIVEEESSSNTKYITYAILIIICLVLVYLILKKKDELKPKPKEEKFYESEPVPKEFRNLRPLEVFPPEQKTQQAPVVRQLLDNYYAEPIPQQPVQKQILNDNHRAELERLQREEQEVLRLQQEKEKTLKRMNELQNKQQYEEDASSISEKIKATMKQNKK